MNPSLSKNFVILRLGLKSQNYYIFSKPSAFDYGKPGNKSGKST
jgi:hypothetical protein